MLTKVLVFESDPAFAGELRAEFGNLGCTTTVVDDGNVGLHQAITDKPDLILLSIELPRMNGFSVCNKLKKDPNLKDVPLIIMSSESNEETFDQHKKLRTRAEDYVHKPIAFGQLLEHIRPFVQLDFAQADTEGAIVIDDEIEVGSADYLLDQDIGLSPIEEEEEDDSPTGAHSAPPAALTTRGARPVDADVDAFAESAFDRLIGFEPAPGVEVRAAPNGSVVEPALPVAPRPSYPPARNSSLRPPPPAVDLAEYERTKVELAASRNRLEAVERELDEAVREVGKLRVEASDATRLTREIDDLRGKLAVASKGGGVSSREFLDLREALNKKDKEILIFREHLSKKDREIVEAQDRALALERGRADVEERVLAVERELAEARDAGEALAAERDSLKRGVDEVRGRLDRARVEGEARERQLAELRAKQTDDRLAAEAKLAAVRAEADQLLANERAEQARALDMAEQRRGTDLEQARRDRDAALQELQDQAERDRQDALGVQFAQLRQEHDASVASTRRAHLQELERIRGDAAEHEKAAVEGLRSRHAGELKELADARDTILAHIEGERSREQNEALARIAQLESELAQVRQELGVLSDAKRLSDESNAAQLGDLTRQLAGTQAALEDTGARLDRSTERVGRLQTDLEAARSELADTREKLLAETALVQRGRAKTQSDREFLERAKDALAVALAQIEETETDASGG